MAAHALRHFTERAKPPGDELAEGDPKRAAQHAAALQDLLLWLASYRYLTGTKWFKTLTD